MKGKPRKPRREKDLTDWYLSGELDEDRIDPVQRFSSRAKHFQREKMLRTALMRAEEQAQIENVESLPIGQVAQVYSLFCDVEYQGRIRLCVVRKTLAKVTGGDIVVGDRVRFRELQAAGESGQPEGVVEQVLPRQTVLSRADSFKAIVGQPIVANAQQMLIIASLHQPDVKWGLIDRMIVAARSGGLEAIVCLNKIDLGADGDGDWAFAREALSYYESIGIKTLLTSVVQSEGIQSVQGVLEGRTTVLAGHSGVGKSSLLKAAEPGLDLRIGRISSYTGKGTHTTTSAKRYPLRAGGYVIDTPGVKLFGLWGVTPENVETFFPDVAAGHAPAWRQASYSRIVQSLAPPERFL